MNGVENPSTKRQMEIIEVPGRNPIQDPEVKGELCNYYTKLFLVIISTSIIINISIILTELHLSKGFNSTDFQLVLFFW